MRRLRAGEASVAKSGPTYSLVMFTKDRCNPCAVAKPHVERAAKALGIELTLMDATTREAGPLVLGFGILTVPTVVALKDKKKWQEFSGATELTEKHLVAKLSKLLEKESA
jgi:thioredoxin-like negative regulator of GroEL